MYSLFAHRCVRRCFLNLRPARIPCEWSTSSYVKSFVSHVFVSFSLSLSLYFPLHRHRTLSLSLSILLIESGSCQHISVSFYQLRIYGHERRDISTPLDSARPSRFSSSARTLSLSLSPHLSSRSIPRNTCVTRSCMNSNEYVPGIFPY